jgi:hypothetical protein
MKSFLIVKKSFADFDIPIIDPILVTDHEDIALSKIEKLNSKRSKREINDDVIYDIKIIKKIEY